VFTIIESIIFDIDGTIVDIHPKGIVELYKGIAVYFDRNVPRTESMFKHWYGIDENQIFTELNIPEPEFWEIFRKKDDKEFRKKYLYSYSDSSVLKELEEKGCFVGFNTDAPYDHGLTQLNQIGVSRPYIVANHKGIPRKPNPAGILKIISENNLDIKKTLFVGNTERDVIAGTCAGVRTALIDRGVISSLSVTPDYIFKSLNEIMAIPEEYYKKLSDSLNTKNVTKSIFEEEEKVLDTHFKRVRHHSLTMGILCSSLNNYLGLSKEKSLALGIFHDIDYAKSFFDMSSHGSNSKEFIDNIFTEDLYNDISNHMNKYSNNSKSLFLYAMEGWLKRFVHAARIANKSIKDVTFSEIHSVYSSFDPRRNELLTHYDESESFEEFLLWQKECTTIINKLPINTEVLFKNTKDAFQKYNSIISNLSVHDEMRCINYD
jgi:phosphoglycolate phosphatase-like HAD superfamily hydrolase/predicted hydrolase (HD superfamily)